MLHHSDTGPIHIVQCHISKISEYSRDHTSKRLMLEYITTATTLYVCTYILGIRCLTKTNVELYEDAGQQLVL